MALISLPTDAEFVRNVWHPLRTVQVNRSRYTRRRQTLMIGGDSWTVSAEIVPASTETEVRAWRAFIALLQNEQNTFRMPVVEGDQHLGAESAVATGASGATSITTAAAVNIGPGYYATVPLTGGASQLVLITAVAGTTISFDRPLRDTPVAATLVTKRPYGEVALTAPPAPDDADGTFSWAFEAEEAF